MSFLRPQQDFNNPKLGEEFYRGIVVDNADPDKLHRVKIRIEELHGNQNDIPDSHLPWAIHFRPSFLGGGSNLSSGAIPRIGSDVLVKHIRGEIYQPAYMFELAHAGNRINKVEEDYPESYAMVDSDGNYWHVNMQQDILNILFNGSKVMEITLNRTTTIGNDDTLNVGNNKTESVINTHTQNAATFNINTSGDTNITANGNVNVQGSNINLNGSSAGVLTQESINPLTGTPFPDGSTTVHAGDG